MEVVENNPKQLKRKFLFNEIQKASWRWHLTKNIFLMLAWKKKMRGCIQESISHKLTQTFLAQKSKLMKNTDESHRWKTSMANVYQFHLQKTYLPYESIITFPTGNHVQQLS